MGRTDGIAGESAARSLGWTVAATAIGPATWGTTYFVATELLPAGRPLLAAAIRTLPIGLLLALRSRRRPSGAWWWRYAVLGALNIGAFQALLFVAAFRLPGGVAATVGAVQPLVAAALAAVLLGEVFTRKTALAGIAGIVGVGLLVLRPGAGLDPVGLVAALAATLSMALGVVLTKHWGRPVDLLTSTGWQLTVGGLFLAPVALVFEGPPPELTTVNLMGFAWLAVVGTGLAYALWFRGIGNLPISMTSFLALLSPLVATVIGWLVLHQALDFIQMVGAVLVAGAVVAPQMHLKRLGNLVPHDTGSQGPIGRQRPWPEKIGR